MAKKTQAEAEAQLVKEVEELTKQVRRLKKLEFVKILNRPWKFIGFSLLKGIMVGFGSVIGASVVVAIFIFILSKVSFVPIVGDFVENVMGQIEPSQTTEQQTEDSQSNNP